MQRSGEASEAEPEVWDRQSLAVLEQRITDGDRKAWTTSWGIRRRQRQAAGSEPDSSGAVDLVILSRAPLLGLVVLLLLVAKRLIEGRAGSGDGRWQE